MDIHTQNIRPCGSLVDGRRRIHVCELGPADGRRVRWSVLAVAPDAEYASDGLETIAGRDAMGALDDVVAFIAAGTCGDDVRDAFGETWLEEASAYIDA